LNEAGVYYTCIPYSTVTFCAFVALCMALYKFDYYYYYTPPPSPIVSGTGYCFRSISIDRFLVYIFLSLFLFSKRKRLDRFALNFQGRCGVKMGRRDSILDQFGETARCRDAQHGGGVCCALAPQLVIIISLFALWLL